MNDFTETKLVKNNPIIIKEKLEILSILKDLINNKNFNVEDSLLTKDYLKQLILNNHDIKKYLYAMKEKTKISLFDNKNFIWILSESLNSKYTFEYKFIQTTYLSKVNVFNSEPTFIVELNKTIYDIIKKNLNNYIQKTNTKLILQSNGDDSQMNQKDNIVQKVIPINELNNNDNFDDIDDLQPSVLKNNTFFTENPKNSVLTPKTILNEIYKIRSGNLKSCNKTGVFCFQFKFKINDLTWYLKQFNTIITNILNNTEENINNKKRRDSIIELINENNKMPLIQILLKGIPPSFRIDIYSFLLGININKLYKDDKDNKEDDDSDNCKITDFIKKEKSFNQDLSFSLDYIAKEEINMIADTENYFLHTDVITIIAKELLRDISLLTKTQCLKPYLLISNDDAHTIYPPSGVIPIQGLMYQIAPFAYISNDTNIIYSLFSEFYSKYLCKLSSLSTDSNGLISLLYNFDNIFSLLFNNIKDHFSKLYFDINVEVCKWIMNSFAEILSVQDIFILYDIILLTESNHVLVLAALGIINYKKNILLKLTNHNDLLNTLYHIKFEEIRIVELMKEILN